MAKRWTGAVSNDMSDPRNWRDLNGNAERYRDPQGKRYERPRVIRYRCEPVAEHLIGAEWNDRSLLELHCLRPSMIRVHTGEVTTDSVLWRVTVHVDEEGYIRSITQEVEYGAEL